MAGRRQIETSYSSLKMYAMMKLRLTEFYKDPVIGAGLAAMAIGARDAKYAVYREARLPATGFAKAADLYGGLAGQVQAAIMNIRKFGIDQAEDKCKAIYAYVVTHGLESVKIDNYTAGDAVLAYFGCIPPPTPPTSEVKSSDLEDIEKKIEEALNAKRGGRAAGGGTAQERAQASQQKTIETNVEGVRKGAENAAQQTIQQATGQAAQQTG